jgi:hypothetical protein
VVATCRIFISHSSADAEWVQRVASQAEAVGIHAYLAEHDIQPGEMLADKVITAIEDSNAVVVLLTANGVSSSYVQQEIGVAKRAGKYVIPLVTKDVPMDQLGLLGGVEHITLDVEAPQEALAKLSFTLGRLLERQRRADMEQAEAVQRQRQLILVGAVLVIIGLMILSDGSG